MEQDALNSLLQGGFAPLSPRYNFMGDFFLLGLEAEIDPIVLHFVNSPKPWQYRAVARRAALRRGLSGLVRRIRHGRTGQLRPSQILAAMSRNP